MIVAGIDASTNLTGISIFEDGKYKTHTLINLKKYKDVDVRLPMMMKTICEYLSQWKVDRIIMEKSMMTSNVSTLQLLSYLSGAVMYYAASNNIEFKNPIPGEWRKIVGLQQSNKIKRETLKKEAILAVYQEYGMDVSDDEAESILIARSAFDLPKIEVDNELL